MLIKIYIVLTLLFYFYSKNRNRAVGVLLFFSVSNILLTTIFKQVGVEIFFNNNLYVFIHNLIWLVIIKNFISHKKQMVFIIASYILVNCLTLFYTDVFKEFNFNAFIFGSLTYTLIFIILSYSNLRSENLNFFLSNNYILLFAPILFFFGMSFMFGFRSKSITRAVLVEGLNLYTFVNYFVNIIYYTLINIFIYKERKLHNG
jgi:hypothetical protein